MEQNDVLLVLIHLKDVHIFKKRRLEVAFQSRKVDILHPERDRVALCPLSHVVVVSTQCDRIQGPNRDSKKKERRT